MIITGKHRFEKNVYNLPSEEVSETRKKILGSGNDEEVLSSVIASMTCKSIDKTLIDKIGEKDRKLAKILMQSPGFDALKAVVSSSLIADLDTEARGRLGARIISFVRERMAIEDGREILDAFLRRNLDLLDKDRLYFFVVANAYNLDASKRMLAPGYASMATVLEDLDLEKITSSELLFCFQKYIDFGNLGLTCPTKEEQFSGTLQFLVSMVEKEIPITSFLNICMQSSDADFWTFIDVLIVHQKMRDGMRKEDWERLRKKIEERDWSSSLKSLPKIYQMLIRDYPEMDFSRALIQSCFSGQTALAKILFAYITKERQESRAQIIQRAGELGHIELKSFLFLLEKFVQQDFGVSDYVIKEHCEIVHKSLNVFRRGAVPFSYYMDLIREANVYACMEICLFLSAEEWQEREVSALVGFFLSRNAEENFPEACVGLFVEMMMQRWPDPIAALFNVYFKRQKEAIQKFSALGISLVDSVQKTLDSVLERVCVEGILKEIYRASCHYSSWGLFPLNELLDVFLKKKNKEDLKLKLIKLVSDLSHKVEHLDAIWKGGTRDTGSFEAIENIAKLVTILRSILLNRFECSDLEYLEISLVEDRSRRLCNLAKEALGLPEEESVQIEFALKEDLTFHELVAFLDKCHRKVQEQSCSASTYSYMAKNVMCWMKSKREFSLEETSSLARVSCGFLDLEVFALVREAIEKDSERMCASDVLHINALLSVAARTYLKDEAKNLSITLFNRYKNAPIGFSLLLEDWKKKKRGGEFLQIFWGSVLKTRADKNEIVDALVLLNKTFARKEEDGYFKAHQEFLADSIVDKDVICKLLKKIDVEDLNFHFIASLLFCKTEMLDKQQLRRCFLQMQKWICVFDKQIWMPAYRKVVQSLLSSKKCFIPISHELLEMADFSTFVQMSIGSFSLFMQGDFDRNFASLLLFLKEGENSSDEVLAYFESLKNCKGQERALYDRWQKIEDKKLAVGVLQVVHKGFIYEWQYKNALKFFKENVGEYYGYGSLLCNKFAVNSPEAVLDFSSVAFKDFPALLSQVLKYAPQEGCSLEYLQKNLQQFACFYRAELSLDKNAFAVMCEYYYNFVQFRAITSDVLENVLDKNSLHAPAFVVVYADLIRKKNVIIENSHKRQDVVELMWGRFVQYQDRIPCASAARMGAYVLTIIAYWKLPLDSYLQLLEIRSLELYVEMSEIILKSDISLPQEENEQGFLQRFQNDVSLDLLYKYIQSYENADLELSKQTMDRICSILANNYGENCELLKWMRKGHG